MYDGYDEADVDNTNTVRRWFQRQPLPTDNAPTPPPRQLDNLLARRSNDSNFSELIGLCAGLLSFWLAGWLAGWLAQSVVRCRLVINLPVSLLAGAQRREGGRRKGGREGLSMQCSVVVAS